MGEVLARHPGVHLTINMVPSLVEQMLAWAEGRAGRRPGSLAEQESWSDADRRFILNLCFSVNWDKIIRRYPRYAELLDRRPAALADPAAFSDADYRDLVTWFNLAWIDPNWLERDPVLSALVAKGRGFTAATTCGRSTHKQREIAAGVLPLYRQLAERGPARDQRQPVLPSDPAAPRRHRQRPPAQPRPAAARAALRAPEDAAAQLALAVEAHTAAFRRAAARPVAVGRRGLARDAAARCRAAGFTWLASDEAILARSLGRPFDRDGSNLITDPRALYQPYRVLAGSELGPYIIFRDHELSDRIGFLYQHLPGAQAAEDMIYRLLEIRRRLNDSGLARTWSASSSTARTAGSTTSTTATSSWTRSTASSNGAPSCRAVTVSEYLEGRPARPPRSPGWPPARGSAAT